MYRLITQSRIAQIVILLAALLIVGIAGFYVGVRHEGKDIPVPAYTARTYTSDAIGISFEYPPSLGEPQEAVLERGECEPDSLTERDACEHRYIGFANGKDVKWFLSAESKLYTLHPLPREGFYEDTLTAASIDEYCSHGLYPLSCSKSTNSHGLRVVKVGYSPACNGFELCSDEIFFVNFIETKNQSYPVIAVWYDRSEEGRIPDSAIDQIIESLTSTAVE